MNGAPLRATGKVSGQLRARRDLRLFDADGAEVFITQTCTRCGRTGPLARFGLRRMPDGKIRSIPWCGPCRSTTGKDSEVTQRASEPNAQQRARPSNSDRAGLTSPNSTPSPGQRVVGDDACGRAVEYPAAAPSDHRPQEGVGRPTSRITGDGTCTERRRARSTEGGPPAPVDAAKAPSVIAWAGPSLFTGRSVELLLQGLVFQSVNHKTGAMVQASVVQAGENPSRIRNARDERERDVCGDCPGQKRLDGWCYEDWQPWLIGQRRHVAAPTTLDVATWRVRGKPLRLGAYGDPAAIPFEVWKPLMDAAAGWTGYTHAWRSCDPRWRGYLMASVETPEQARLAASAGWRYFRIRQPGEELRRNETLCLFEDRSMQCADCLLCRGTLRSARHVVITVHGPRASALKVLP